MVSWEGQGGFSTNFLIAAALKINHVEDNPKGKGKSFWFTFKIFSPTFPEELFQRVPAPMPQPVQTSLSYKSPLPAEDVLPEPE